MIKFPNCCKAILIVILFFSMATLPACGRKGPPRPPVDTLYPAAIFVSSSSIIP
jgi:predicted small lipoprotein YifL